MHNLSFTPLAILMVVLQVSGHYRVSLDVMNTFIKDCGIVKPTYDKHIDEGGDSMESYSRIVGGEVAETAVWPWMAHVHTFPASKCGGTIVGPRHILTAAHCYYYNGTNNTIMRNDPKKMSVVLGATNMKFRSAPEEWAKQLRRQYTVVEIVPHPNFTMSFDANIVHRHDISLVILGTDIELNDFTVPICLPPNDMPKDHLNGKNAIAIGWGRTDRDPAKVDFNEIGKMRYVSLTIFTAQICSNYMNPNKVESREITQFHVCAGSKTGPGKGACFGDSGGPLVATMVNTTERKTWMQVGIISQAPPGCGEDGYPLICTRVSEYAKWIIGQILLEDSTTTPPPTTTEYPFSSSYYIEPCLYFSLFYSIAFHYILHFYSIIHTKWILLSFP